MKMLGSVIRKARNEKGMTLEGLAYELEMDEKHLSRIETGKKNPSSMTLIYIAKAIDLDLNAYVNTFHQSINNCE